jgi:hypothetical protein
MNPNDILAAALKGTAKENLPSYAGTTTKKEEVIEAPAPKPDVNVATDASAKPAIEAPAEGGEKPVVEEPKPDVNVATDASAKPAIEAPAATDASAAMQPAEPVKLSDEDLLAILKERGVDASSLEDLKAPVTLTPEQQEEKKAQVREKAIQNGLTSGLFTAKELQEFNVTTAKPARDIAFELFANDQKRRDASVTDEDIADRFAEKYGENLPDDSWLKKEGQDAMEHLKQAYISNRFAKINNAEGVYEQSQQVTKAAQTYKTSVDNIFNTLDKEYKTSFQDANPKGGADIIEEFSYVYSADEMEAVKKQFLTEDSFRMLGTGELDPQRLKISIELALKGMAFDKIVKGISRGYASKLLLREQAERKAVLPEGTAASSIALDEEKAFDPRAQAMLDQWKGKKRA